MFGGPFKGTTRGKRLKLTNTVDANSCFRCDYQYIDIGAGYINLKLFFDVDFGTIGNK